MKELEKAYIAGFLDGDGSIMLQLKPRKRVSFGFRARTIVCFYQDKRYINGIVWIKKRLGYGYLSNRKDNITELRIEGYKRVKQTLINLYPYIIFKKQQLVLILKAISILEKKPNPKQFLEVCKISDEISRINYATTRKKYNYQFVKKAFLNKGLYPLND